MGMITLSMRDFTDEHEAWIAKHVGPRMHWLHNSRGGRGWIAKRASMPGTWTKYWTLSFEDDRYATFFGLMFSHDIGFEPSTF
jgi:hypothetical protein